MGCLTGLVMRNFGFIGTSFCVSSLAAATSITGVSSELGSNGVTGVMSGIV